MRKSINIIVVLVLAWVVMSTLPSGKANQESGELPFKLFRAIIAEKSGENILFSPDSLKTSLALLEMGAAGETAKEIRALLGNEEKKTSKEGDQADALASRPNVTALTSLWLQKGAPILPEFLDKAKKRFDADAQLLDFAGNVDEATQKINAWVAEKTENRIPMLYDRLDSDSRLVAVSAVAFEDCWKTTFDKEETFAGEFTLLDGKKIKSDFMSQTGRFQHKECNEALILELPYETAGYSMLILVPHNTTLAEMETKISAEKLAEWCGELEEKEIEIQIPKFALESETECNDILRTLGVNRAFSRDADFSRINGLQDLYLSDVKQRVFLRVDESGTEAAAATGAVLKPKAMFKETKSFYANRPFLFVIRHKETSDILFLGRIVDPQGETKQEETMIDPSLSGEGGSFN